MISQQEPSLKLFFHLRTTGGTLSLSLSLTLSLSLSLSLCLSLSLSLSLSLFSLSLSLSLSLSDLLAKVRQAFSAVHSHLDFRGCPRRLQKATVMLGDRYPLHTWTHGWFSKLLGVATIDASRQRCCPRLLLAPARNLWPAEHQKKKTSLKFQHNNYLWREPIQAWNVWKLIKTFQGAKANRHWLFNSKSNIQAIIVKI